MIKHDEIADIQPLVDEINIHEETGKIAAAPSEDVRSHLGFGAYDSRGQDFDADDAYQLGLAYGDIIDGEYIVGRDARTDSEEIKNALIQGLEDQGVEVVDIGLAPTDMVSYAIQSTGADAGVAVTASHMPPGYHGVKPLNSQGRIFDAGELDIATENYLNNQVTRPAYQDTGEENNQEIYEKYIDGVVERYEELFQEDLSGLRIGVDPMNGMGAYVLPEILERLGVEEDDLYFINDDLEEGFKDRDPDPTKDSLEHLSHLVTEQDLDIGIALDGDADRAVYINEQGEKVGGDESLAILGEKFLETELEAGIAVSGNTATQVQEHINQQNGVVQHQPVGAVFPAKAALKNEDPQIVLGGQPNGHYLDPGFTPYDSGPLFATIMPGIIKQRKTRLSQLQQELPQYIVQRHNIETPDKQQTLQEWTDSLDYKIFQENGITKGLKNGHIITLRPSGSEPVVRATVETPAPVKTITDMETDNDPIEYFRDLYETRDKEKSKEQTSEQNTAQKIYNTAKSTFNSWKQLRNQEIRQN